MADQASCFGCGGRFERTAVKDVGDAFFCPACFARLLAPVADRAPSPAETLVPPRARPAPEPEPPEAALGLCFLCMSPVGADAFVRLRDFVICRPCSDELMRDPVEPEEIAARPARAVVEIAPHQMRPVLPRHTPGTGTEVCAGCGRVMPGPGSYRVVDGQPFCPACAPQVIRPPSYQRTPTPALTPAVVPFGVRLCDCCVRPLADDQFRITGGYWICLACLDSDARLAHAVARARYRRRLARMKAAMETAPGDAGDPGDDAG